MSLYCCAVTESSCPTLPASENRKSLYNLAVCESFVLRSVLRASKSGLQVKMQCEISQSVVRLLVVVLVVSLAAVSAKPPHFQENAQGLVSDQDPAINNFDTGLRPWQLELIAQRMAELNQLSQLSNLNNGQEYGGFDRALRSGNEIKRQSRYRLCYFNPVSCFKK